jgi:hypothetical protein
MPRYREIILDYLSGFDDGGEISPGTAPEQDSL